MEKAQKNGEVAEPSGGENGDPRRLAEVYSNAVKDSLTSYYDYIPYRHKSQVTIVKNHKKRCFSAFFLFFRHNSFCFKAFMGDFVYTEVLFQLEEAWDFVYSYPIAKF